MPEMLNPTSSLRTVQAHGSAINGKAIRPADMKLPSAAKTRRCPTRRIITGLSWAPDRKPTKYPEVTMASSVAENASIPPRRPISVKCMPLPSMISTIPRSRAQTPDNTLPMNTPVRAAIAKLRAALRRTRFLQRRI